MSRTVPVTRTGRPHSAPGGGVGAGDPETRIPATAREPSTLDPQTPIA